MKESSEVGTSPTDGDGFAVLTELFNPEEIAQRLPWESPLEGPYTPSRQKTGTSPYTRNGERCFSPGELRQIASLFRAGKSQQETMNEVGFFGNFLAFQKSVELSGHRLVRLIEKGQKGRYYTQKRAMTLLELYTLQELWLKPHSVDNSVAYMSKHFGMEFRSSTRLFNILKRSGYTSRNAIMSEDHWKAQLGQVQAMRKKLEEQDDKGKSNSNGG